MKNVILTSLLVFSKSAIAANLSSFHNHDFGSLDASVCGFHAEVSGSYLALQNIPNKIAPASDTADCGDYGAVLMKCNRDTCVEVVNPDAPNQGSDRATLLSDGNFIYQNADGKTYKNFRY